MSGVGESLNMERSRGTVVICGPVCAGKSTLARALAQRLRLPIVTGQQAIEYHAKSGALGRAGLQRLGQELEQRRPGSWLADAVDALVGQAQAAVVDAARTAEQVRALRSREGGATVVHLTAVNEVRQARYEHRSAARDRPVSFELLASSQLEREAVALGEEADRAVDTTDLPAEEVARRVFE